MRETFREIARADLESWRSSNPESLQRNLPFALGRFEEGVGFVRYLEHSIPEKPGDVLDVGTGTGGVGLAFANCRRFRVFSVDIGQNRILRQVAEATGLSIRYSLASGLELPYRDETFDVVLLIEALEHIPKPRILGCGSSGSSGRAGSA